MVWLGERDLRAQRACGKWPFPAPTWGFPGAAPAQEPPAPKPNSPSSARAGPAQAGLRSPCPGWHARPSKVRMNPRGLPGQARASPAVPGPRRGGRRSRAQLTPAAGGAAVRGAADRRRSLAAAARRERGCRGSGDQDGRWCGCREEGQGRRHVREPGSGTGGGGTRTGAKAGVRLEPESPGTRTQGWRRALGAQGLAGPPGRSRAPPSVIPPPPRARGAGRDWLPSICHAAIGWRGRAARDVSAQPCATGGHL